MRTSLLSRLIDHAQQHDAHNLVVAVGVNHEVALARQVEWHTREDPWSASESSTSTCMEGCVVNVTLDAPKRKYS